MAHPKLNRPSAGRVAVVIAGAALLLPAAQASALTAGGIGTVAEVSCETEVVTLACETAADALDAASPLTDALAPTLDAAPVEVPLPEVIGAVPVVGEVMGEVMGEESGAEPTTPGEATPVTPGGQTSGSTTGSSSTAAADDAESGKVEAAGKNTTEVSEPQAPAADGRVTGTPTIQPANLGSNIPGVRSQNGLTLQPYQAPMVSVPAATTPAPQIASGPVSTATPVQALAAEAISFTGEAFVPYTTGATAWVTATALGLLGAAGYGMRRRADVLRTTSLDD